jgi:uncharacterized protein (UPF0332 family)
MVQHPPAEKAWLLILYQDGVDPSDGLSNNHSRKSAVFYWSFLEFGMEALSNELNWFPIALGRSKVLQKADGQITQLALKAALLFFDGGHDITLSGVTLKLEGDNELVTIFASIGIVLADEPAVKEIYSCKGHSGAKPCLICMNAVSHNGQGGADGLHEHGAYPVSIRVLRLSAFKQHSDASLRYAVQKLHSMRAPGRGFEALETLYGFGYNAYSLIVHERLNFRAASSLMWDWGHCYVCDGLADVEFGAFMKHMHTNRTEATYAELQSYSEGWSLPKSLPKVTQLFDETAARNNLRKGSFTSSASEFLTLIPILIRYLTVICIARGACTPQVRSLAACLFVLELLQAIKRGVVDPDSLHYAIERHLKLFVEAYGDEFVRPKHHYVLHLGTMLRFFGTLLATFVNERKHRRVKQYSRDRHSLKSWELGCLEEITCHQVHEMSRPYMHAGIIDAHPASRKLLPLLAEMFPGVPNDSFAVSNSCKTGNGYVKVGDMVMWNSDGWRVGELLMLLKIESCSRAILSKWEACDAGPLARFARYRLVDDASLIVSTDVLECSLTHRPSGEFSIVYVPLEYRGHVEPC